MHGQSVRFYCNRGYHRVGASPVTCNDGKWDKQLPLCKGENYLIDLSILLSFNLVLTHECDAYPPFFQTSLLLTVSRQDLINA